MGPYEILGELGRGGMGAVYLARHRPTGARRALKVLSEGQDLDRFRREIEALARAGGAGVVPVHESGVAGRTLWYAMEIMPGGSLKARLKARGALPWREAVAIVAVIARALGRGHALGLVHRDVKPENVLFDDQGAPRIADFGCVRDLDAPSLTATGAWIGTPGYMAPEQLDGERVGPPGDVFALGVVLYELIQGERPYEASSVMQLAIATAKGRRKPLRDVPDELRAIVDRALAGSAGARTPDGTRLADELDALLAGAASPPARSRLGIAIAAGAVLAILLAVGLAARPRPAPPAKLDAVAPTATATTREPTLGERIGAWRKANRPIPVEDLAAAAAAAPDPGHLIAQAARDLGIEGAALPPELAAAFRTRGSPLARALEAVDTLAAALATVEGRQKIRTQASSESDRHLDGLPSGDLLGEAWRTITSPAAAKTYPALVAPIFPGLEALALEDLEPTLKLDGPDPSPAVKGLAASWSRVSGLPPVLSGLLAVGTRPDGERASLAKIGALKAASDELVRRGQVPVALCLLACAVHTARDHGVTWPGMEDMIKGAVALGTDAARREPDIRQFLLGMVVNIEIDCCHVPDSRERIAHLVHANQLAHAEGLADEPNAANWLVRILVEQKQWARVDELVPAPPAATLPEVLCARARVLFDRGEREKAAAALKEARARATSLPVDDRRSTALEETETYLTGRK